jgi:ketol-acid reductoisomerase
LIPWWRPVSSKNLLITSRLHETPLIANTIARKRLYEMNVVISDTAEYGNYLFSQCCCADAARAGEPHISPELLGKGLAAGSNGVDNVRLIEVNDAIRNHPVENRWQEHYGAT